MGVPFLSLSAATLVGAGDSHDLEEVLSNHSMVVTISGYSGTGNVQVDLQFSHDDVNWVTVQYAEVSSNADGTFIIPSGPSFQIGGYPCRYVRAYLKQLSSGGATVTATVASN